MLLPMGTASLKATMLPISMRGTPWDKERVESDKYMILTLDIYVPK